MKTLLFLILISTASSQNSDAINKIKINFGKWQTYLKNTDTEGSKFYHYYFGDNYNKDIWTIDTISNDEYFLADIADLISNDKLGYRLAYEQTSLSGDWFIKSEYYFEKNGDLYFMFWSMNTYYSDHPLTVERRLYFNNKTQIKKIESFYKMNTKVKINKPGFMDKDVNIWLNISELPFKNLIKE